MALALGSQLASHLPRRRDAARMCRRHRRQDLRISRCSVCTPATFKRAAFVLWFMLRSSLAIAGAVEQPPTYTEYYTTYTTSTSTSTSSSSNESSSTATTITTTMSTALPLEYDPGETAQEVSSDVPIPMWDADPGAPSLGPVMSVADDSDDVLLEDELGLVENVTPKDDREEVDEPGTLPPRLANSSTYGPGFYCEVFTSVTVDGNFFPEYHMADATPDYSLIDAVIQHDSTGIYQDLGCWSTCHVRWSAYLQIDIAGDYLFKLSSDDGSRMFINDELLVDNGGYHGTVMRKQTVRLGSGTHFIVVQYWQGGGGATAILRYAGPDTSGWSRLVKAVEAVPPNEALYTPGTTSSATSTTTTTSPEANCWNQWCGCPNGDFWPSGKEWCEFDGKINSEWCQETEEQCHRCSHVWCMNGRSTSTFTTTSTLTSSATSTSTRTSTTLSSSSTSTVTSTTVSTSSTSTATSTTLSTSSTSTATSTTLSTSSTSTTTSTTMSTSSTSTVTSTTMSTSSTSTSTSTTVSTTSASRLTTSSITTTSTSSTESTTTTSASSVSTHPSTTRSSSTSLSSGSRSTSTSTSTSESSTSLTSSSSMTTTSSTSSTSSPSSSTTTRTSVTSTSSLSSSSSSSSSETSASTHTTSTSTHSSESSPSTYDSLTSTTSRSSLSSGSSRSSTSTSPTTLTSHSSASTYSSASSSTSTASTPTSRSSWSTGSSVTTVTTTSSTSLSLSSLSTSSSTSLTTTTFPTSTSTSLSTRSSSVSSLSSSLSETSMSSTTTTRSTRSSQSSRTSQSSSTTSPSTSSTTSSSGSTPSTVTTVAATPSTMSTGSTSSSSSTSASTPTSETTGSSKSTSSSTWSSSSKTTTTGSSVSSTTTTTSGTSRASSTSSATTSSTTPTSASSASTATSHSTTLSTASTASSIATSTSTSASTRTSATSTTASTTTSSTTGSSSTPTSLSTSTSTSASSSSSPSSSSTTTTSSSSSSSTLTSWSSSTSSHSSTSTSSSASSTSSSSSTSSTSSSSSSTSSSTTTATSTTSFTSTSTSTSTFTSTTTSTTTSTSTSTSSNSTSTSTSGSTSSSTSASSSTSSSASTFTTWSSTTSTSTSASEEPVIVVPPTPPPAQVVIDAAQKAEENLLAELVASGETEATVATPTGVTTAKVISLASANISADDQTATVAVAVEGSVVTASISVEALLAVGGNAVAMVTTFNDSMVESFAQEEKDSSGRSVTLLAAPVSIRLLDENGQELKVSDLTNPIKVTLMGQDDIPTTINDGEILACAWFDEDERKWMFEDLTRVDDEDGAFVCASTHLTVFGAILRGLLNSLECANVEVLTPEGIEALGDATWWHGLGAILLYVLLVGQLITLYFITKAFKKDMEVHEWNDRNLLTDNAAYDKANKPSMMQRATDMVKENMQLLHPNGLAEYASKLVARETLAWQQKVNASDLDEIMLGAQAQSHEESSTWAETLGLRQSKTSGKLGKGRSMYSLQTMKSEKSINTDVTANSTPSDGSGGTRITGLQQMSEAATQKTKKTVTTVEVPLVRKVFTRAEAAFQHFHAATFFQRVWILFNATNAWISLRHFSFTVPPTTRGLLLMCRMEGSLFVSALFFVSSGGKSRSSPADCSPANFWENLGRNIMVMIGAWIVGSVPYGIMSSLAWKSFVYDDNWSDEKKRKYLVRWRAQAWFLWLIAVSYCAFCVFYLAAFLANTGRGSEIDWVTSALCDLVNEILITPLVVSFLLAILVGWAEGRRPQIIEVVQQNMKMLHRVVGGEDDEAADSNGLRRTAAGQSPITYIAEVNEADLMDKPDAGSEPRQTRGATMNTSLEDEPEAEPFDHSELSPSRGSSSLPIASRSPSSRIQTSLSMTRVASGPSQASHTVLTIAATPVNQKSPAGKTHAWASLPGAVFDADGTPTPSAALANVEAQCLVPEQHLPGQGAGLQPAHLPEQSSASSSAPACTVVNGVGAALDAGPLHSGAENSSAAPGADLDDEDARAPEPQTALGDEARPDGQPPPLAPPRPDSLPSTTAMEPRGRASSLARLFINEMIEPENANGTESRTTGSEPESAMEEPQTPQNPDGASRVVAPM